MTPARTARGRIAPALLALASAACAPAAAPPAPAAAAQAAPGVFRYEVVAGPGARELSIEARLPPGPARRLGLEPGAEPFVRDVAFAAGSGPLRPLAPSGPTWPAPPCPAPGCRLRYRFLLADAAAAIDHYGTAEDRDGALLAPAGTWLLRSTSGEDAGTTRFQLRVSTPEGIRFVSGLFRSAADPAAFEATLGDLYADPYAAFGPFTVHRREAAGSEVEVAFLPGPLELGEAPVLGWIDDAARAVTSYYGRYPVPRALILILPGRGHGAGFATARGNGGAAITSRIGRATTAAELASAWEMTHEMLHVAFPNLAARHSWLEEGLATYVEPIARARLGMIKAEDVWRRFAWGLPHGLPGPDDRGLDHTPTWGRTYWGGTLFCLLADVEIRERTGNQRSLDDALRGILAAGGNISARWPIERVLSEGDRATGVPVLSELYARMAAAPVDVDLAALWRRLGVRVEGGRVALDDAAPLAAIRAAITRPAPAPAAGSAVAELRP